MKKLVVLFVALSGLVVMTEAAPASRSVDGVVVDESTGEPLQGAVVSLESLWSVTDEKGRFSISGMQEGRYDLKVQLLGYSDYALQITVKRDISVLKIRMKESSLALKEVVVTSSRPKDGTGTSHTIGRDALNHLQLSNVTDMAALLPGGKTVNPDLTSAGDFTIRSAGSTAGNAAFSAAVEVDGVRIGNNASFGDPSGVDLRNVSVDNIESVEVISGVASAEYGDFGSGMVKIRSKHGRTPVNVTLSVNPRTWQGSVSKGIGLGNGVLNVSGEWARATKKLTSPYESYTRRSVSAIYSNTFARKLRFEAGITGNIGGMNSENDPDAYKGEYTKSSDNVVRANTSLNWLLNLPWITSLEMDASVNYNDCNSHAHKYNSSASQMPAVHSETEGYAYATLLPKGIYYSDKIVDSRELDAASSLKYSWSRRFGRHKSAFKAGVQWKCNGNVGEGEYYEVASLAADGYRPRPYRDYPFMHNLSVYAEEDFKAAFGLQATAGVRMDRVFVKGSQYRNLTSFSPRFNLKWAPSDKFSVHGGWGVAEKLPSFHTLYPEQEYRDILTQSGASADGSPYYMYYTVPYRTVYNPDLKWQRTENSEIGIDASFLGLKVSLTGFYNITKNPYKFSNAYTPVTVDRGGLQDVTFVAAKIQSNGAPVRRGGVELMVDFPKIEVIRTGFRLDATYGHSHTEDRSEYYYYNTGWSHTGIKNRSYQYVGIYNNGGNSSLYVCGETTDNMDANLTSITHIPEARLVITCRLEMSVFDLSRKIPTQGTDAVYPVAYMTEDGSVHEFTDADKTDPEFSALVRKPSNDYVFDLDGYGFYAFANLSVTKEIGRHVSLSFFANNFTNARPAVTSRATGVSAIFTPAFYYGLTCRIKI